ncbi:excitatory amino acid transporter 3-like protein [Lates japonicus]|uniref:Amino acid transporter n=1 Tax=Lates japonicus TaxID=270547 RepID=A0AAD3MR06_LATJO|nr:excitatory amino acid transporter 3-like protein [Lates japonicus]
MDVLDPVRNMVPENLVQACFQQYKTDKLEFEVHTSEPNSSVVTNYTDMQLVGHSVGGANTLGLIVCSFIFGLTLYRMGERGKILVEVITIINEVMKYVVSLILYYLPFAVLFMIAGHVVDVHDWNTTYSLGKFMAVVFIGLIIHGVIVVPLVYLLWVRRNPWVVVKGVSPALLTALFISSSSATLPLTLQCCEAAASCCPSGPMSTWTEEAFMRNIQISNELGEQEEDEDWISCLESIESLHTTSEG